jgi:hypothetical protein
MINALFDTTKVVGTLIWEAGSYEVCAEATANHARGENILTVHLRSFLRATQQVHLGETLQPDVCPI